MLKKCIQLLGLSRDSNNGSKRKNSLKGSPYPETISTDKSASSLSLNLKSKESFVRIVHRGGREELYPCELSALQLMKKYPGTQVATPEIFNNPHESVLWPEQKLFPGHKYFLIPASSVRKLKQKHENANESSEWDHVVMNPRNANFEESVFSAKDFFLPPNGRSSGSNLLIKGIRKKKPFVPPLPKPRSFRMPGWEPSLTSVQELSP